MGVASSNQARSLDELKDANFGDKRLGKRLKKMVDALSKNPEGTLPGALKCPFSIKAAYRFLDNEKTSYASVLAPYIEVTRQACSVPGSYLLIEDTTNVSFNDRSEISGMGQHTTAESLGLLLHSTLAFRIKNWSEKQEPCLEQIGLFGQACWTRLGERKKGFETQAERHKRPRESEKWLANLEDFSFHKKELHFIFVGDREADIFACLKSCQDKGLGFVVRAAKNRKIKNTLTTLFKTMKNAEVLGEYTLKLRARQGVKARQAKLIVTTKQVTLNAPKHLAGQNMKPLYVVQVKEAGCPKKGVTPIDWILLTSEPVETFEAALQVIQIYSKRWLIEEYHKCLKSGTKIEAIQLGTYDRITTLLGIYAIIACCLLEKKLLAQDAPDDPLCITECHPLAIKILEHKYTRPKNGWTNKTYYTRIACLAGFMNRKGDGLPGWQLIWKGWQKLQILIEGAQLAQQMMKKETYG